MRIPSCNSLSLLSHDLWSLLSCKNIVLSHQMRRICSSRVLCLFHGIYSVVVLACRCQQNFFSKVLELHTHEPPTDVYVVYIHFSQRNLRRTSINNKRKFSRKIFDDGTNLELELPSYMLTPTHALTHTYTVRVDADCLSRRVENSKAFAMDQNYGATRFAYKNISLNNFFSPSIL